MLRDASMNMNRINNLKDEMKKNNLDYYVVSDQHNIAYLLGIKEIPGRLLISTKYKPRFFVEIVYYDHAAKAIKGCEIVPIQNQELIGRFMLKELETHLSSTAFDRLDYLVYSAYVSLFGRRPNVNPDLLMTLRRRKDMEEMRLIRKAILIADTAIKTAREVIRPGISELEVLGEMQYVMRKMGSEGEFFSPIIASGYRSCWPNAPASNKMIRKKELILIDVGPFFHCYVGDISRTFIIGEPNQKQRSILEMTKRTEEEVLKMIHTGVKAQNVHRSIEKILQKNGFNSFLAHSGHGLGIGSEPPWIKSNSRDILELNDFIAIEPGVYVPGVGGARIEDNVLVKDYGYEMISQAPKDFVI
jgi:Xaa-Pro aminopeptidase